MACTAFFNDLRKFSVGLEKDCDSLRHTYENPPKEQSGLQSVYRLLEESKNIFVEASDNFDNIVEEGTLSMHISVKSCRNLLSMLTENIESVEAELCQYGYVRPPLSEYKKADSSPKLTRHNDLTEAVAAVTTATTENDKENVTEIEADSDSQVLTSSVHDSELKKGSADDDGQENSNARESNSTNAEEEKEQQQQQEDSPSEMPSTPVTNTISKLDDIKTPTLEDFGISAASLQVIMKPSGLNFEQSKPDTFSLPSSSVTGTADLSSSAASFLSRGMSSSTITSALTSAASLYNSKSAATTTASAISASLSEDELLDPTAYGIKSVVVLSSDDLLNNTSSKENTTLDTDFTQKYSIDSDITGSYINTPLPSIDNLRTEMSPTMPDEPAFIPPKSAALPTSPASMTEEEFMVIKEEEYNSLSKYIQDQVPLDYLNSALALLMDCITATTADRTLVCFTEQHLRDELGLGPPTKAFLLVMLKLRRLQSKGTNSEGEKQYGLL